MKRRILLLLSEKSTYAGLVTFLSGAAIFGLDEGTWQSIAAALATISGLLMTVLLDNGDKEKLNADLDS